MARVTRGAFHLPNTFKIQGGDTDIAVNSLELVIPGFSIDF